MHFRSRSGPARRAWRGLPVGVAASLLLAAAAPASAPTPPATVRVFHGEVGQGVEATFRINAPLAQVYGVLADPRPGAEYLPYITKVEVLTDDGVTQVVKYHARHLGLFDVDYVLRRQLQGARGIGFAQERGMFKRTVGSWRLVPVAGGTRAIYQVQVDPGFYVPRSIQSFFLQQGLPKMTDAIRRRAETGGTWRKP